MQHVWGRCEMHTKLWLEYLRGRDHSEDEDIDGRKISKTDLWETGFGGVD
jgi:hypothetical protein